MCPDHPHARGENHDSPTRISDYVGPSPRTWGERGLTNADIVAWRTIPTHVGRTPVGILGAHTLGRTIPTHVGRTPNPLSGRLMLADHPHARGENVLESGLAANQGGPSPRTWGERCRSLAS